MIAIGAKSRENFRLLFNFLWVVPALLLLLIVAAGVLSCVALVAFRLFPELYWPVARMRPVIAPALGGIFLMVAAMTGLYAARKPREFFKELPGWLGFFGGLLLFLVVFVWFAHIAIDLFIRYVY